jgi:lipopolysaccharide transport system permease protein
MDLILEPGRAEKNYWRDLWRYRELFIILAWRDVTVRYKQTVIGVAWALIRPFLTVVVFTFFAKMVGANIPKDVPPRFLSLPPSCPGLFFQRQ